MSVLPNEIFADLTNFLPNDDITDLMLLSRNFNALVTPRLRKIDEEMSAMNQSIKSFMPSSMPQLDDYQWIRELNLKRFEPIGSKAKKGMKDAFERLFRLFESSCEEWRSNFDVCLDCHSSGGDVHSRIGALERFKEGMSLERFDDATFLRILSVLISVPEFRQEYNIPLTFAHYITSLCQIRINARYLDFTSPSSLAMSKSYDLERIWRFYYYRFMLE